ncbi:MAG: SufE family protein [Candidatus Kapaibacterium sp.]
MNINEIQDRIIEEYSGYDDWFDMYEAIIAEGDKLTPFDMKNKTDDNSISGCQSKIWLLTEMNGKNMKITGDSDAKITRGILALLLRTLDGQPPKDIAGSDLYFIEKIGLGSNLSPARSDGLNAIIREIKDRAGKYYPLLECGNI